MHADRYLKIILTIIAVELFWIAAKDLTPTVQAQQAATPVVIRGIDPDAAKGTYLPVALVGAYRDIPDNWQTMLERLMLETRRPIRIEADRPLPIRSDRPLKVENVRYTPAERPGE